MSELTLGSLFDGIGTALLAAEICGIKPVWSSEIEPFPMAVSKHNFPDVKQLGDVTKINGAEIEPVDIIFFGSPCQDLSQAGLRKGLQHESKGDEETTRSGLFMEAVRIAKEMRKADEIRQLQVRGADEHFRPDPRPHFLCWENVPGALTSSGGADFQCVLEELAKIKDKTAHVPLPSNGRWGDSGQVAGDGYSICYRVLDSQYFGVPQRRKRIFLVCSLSDNVEQAFRDSCLGSGAAEILFKQKGLRGDFEKSLKERQKVARPFGESIKAADSKTYDARGNGDGEISCTIVGGHQDRVTDYTSLVVEEALAFEGNGNRPSHHGDGYRNPGEPMYTLNTTEVHGVAMRGGISWDGQETMPTLTTRSADQFMPDKGNFGAVIQEIIPKEPVVYGISSYASNSMKSSNPDSGVYEAETTRTLDLNGGNPSCNQGGMAIVQRLACGKDVCPTLTVGDFEKSRYNNECLEKLIVYSRGFGGQIGEDITPTLEARAGTGGQ